MFSHSTFMIAITSPKHRCVKAPNTAAYFHPVLCRLLRQQSSWGQHGAHLGPVGPRWAPCWPHEPFYQGPPLPATHSYAILFNSIWHTLDETIKWPRHNNYARAAFCVRSDGHLAISACYYWVVWIVAERGYQLLILKIHHYDLAEFEVSGPFTKLINLIQAWVSNHIPSKVLDKIIY